MLVGRDAVPAGVATQPCPRAGTGTNVAWVIRPRASGPRTYANADDTAVARRGTRRIDRKMRRPDGVIRASRTCNSGGPAKQPRSRVFSARHPPRGDRESERTTGEPPRPIKNRGRISVAV